MSCLGWTGGKRRTSVGGASIAASRASSTAPAWESGMAKTVSDQLIERLVEWGVHRVYGYSGDG
ncbi:MAG: hypothetical protein ACJ8GJ_24780, partial [Vitreoscilla sp.]